MMRSIDKLRNNGRLSSECLVPVAMAAYVLTSQPSTVIFSSSIERVLPIRPEGSYYVPDGHEKLKCILAIVGESRVKEIPGPSPEQHMEQHTACVCAEIGAIDATFKMHTDFTQASLEGTIVTYGYPNRDEGTRPRFMDSCGNRGCPLRWGCHQLLEECRITAIKPGKMATRSSLPEIVQIKQADQGEGVLKPDAKKGSWF
ncbi:hypothetical protein F4777DRAFT_128464 [Nemania sp. FL0916]|nr:hypothetical protein F4777DRAFT_128464 [Nemania sp. FL0916]